MVALIDSSIVERKTNAELVRRFASTSAELRVLQQAAQHIPIAAMGTGLMWAAWARFLQALEAGIIAIETETAFRSSAPAEGSVVGTALTGLAQTLRTIEHRADQMEQELPRAKVRPFAAEQ